MKIVKPYNSNVITNEIKLVPDIMNHRKISKASWCLPHSFILLTKKRLERMSILITIISWSRLGVNLYFNFKQISQRIPFLY